jgi:hypothetical protein
MAEVAECKPHPAGLGNVWSADAEVIREPFSASSRGRETGLWEVRTDAPNYRQLELPPPRQPELVLLFASPIPVRFG